MGGSDAAFLQKRRRIIRLWPWGGVIAVVALLVAGIALWIRQPYLVNPWHTLEQLESGSLPDSTLALMAAMLPIVTLGWLVSMGLVLLFAFMAWANERRLIRIIDESRQAGNP